MTPKVRSRLRVHIDAIYNIIKNEELLNYEYSCLNSALELLVNADYYLAHAHISHSRAKSLLGLHIKDIIDSALSADKPKPRVSLGAKREGRGKKA